MIEHFVAVATARCAAELVGVNHTTAISYYHRLRELIAYHAETEADETLAGKVEVAD